MYQISDTTKLMMYQISGTTKWMMYQISDTTKWMMYQINSATKKTDVLDQWCLQNGLVAQPMTDVSDQRHHIMDGVSDQ